MGIINLLDVGVSNKIAAGEVVERPASVIKELVENGIDAGAGKITVEIRNGGVAYMRVSDNGCGMSREDAEICFFRHATSKIKNERDLDAISTLGFRGEALSSIGAVAKVSLYTKRAEDANGTLVSCRGGEILYSDEAGIPNGTSVIVEDLFYNTPARLKFLKKDATEAGYITDIITRFIFAHPEISFRLTVNGKDKLFSPGDNSLKNAVYTAYGKDYAKGVLEVEYEENGVRVSGLIGKGTLARPNRNYQSFFVNKRYIKSPLIIRAVEDAYKNQVMIGKFPMAVLNIETDPSLMDINVHPTKLEVKFADERSVRGAVYYAVKNTLYALPNVPEIERKNNDGASFERDNASHQLDLSELAASLPKDIPERGNAGSKRPANYPPKPFSEASFVSSAEIQKILDAGGNTVFNDSARGKNGRASSEKAPAPRIEKPKARASFNETLRTEKKEAVSPAPRENGEKTADAAENIFLDEYFEVIGQIFNTYIIAQKDDKMLLIDQHAAHERLKYEALKQSLSQKQLLPQMLIEPAIVKMTGTEFSAFSDIKSTLYDMGFECDEFGDDEIIVRGAPDGLEASEIEGLILELVTNAGNMKHELISERNERMLYTIACKAAIKANHKLSKTEMEALVRDVLCLKNINTCPHGRPIIISMSKKEIEKEFKRIV